ncbi:NmrA/HSCARG family protein [Candidatus Bathyarchaeota archaeon]|nr:NmrA/HSCARG family protein [Candidatus Bathyarchaeota archaeon]
MSKILTIFGATGAQGASVINAVLADPVLSGEYELRGTTRDISKPAAKALSGKGVKMISVSHQVSFQFKSHPQLTYNQADMSSPDSLAPAIAGSHTVFLVTNFWDSGSRSAETEIAQGKAVADACKTAGVRHLIFSSLVSPSKVSGGNLTHMAHFESKAAVEEHIRRLGVPATFVLLGWYMENFFHHLRRGGDGGYIWELPVDGDKSLLPLIDAGRDTGTFLPHMLPLLSPKRERLTRPRHVRKGSPQTAHPFRQAHPRRRRVPQPEPHPGHPRGHHRQERVRRAGLGRGVQVVPACGARAGDAREPSAARGPGVLRRGGPGRELGDAGGKAEDLDRVCCG